MVWIRNTDLRGWAISQQPIRYQSCNLSQLSRLLTPVFFSQPNQTRTVRKNKKGWFSHGLYDWYRCWSLWESRLHSRTGSRLTKNIMQAQCHLGKLKHGFWEIRQDRVTKRKLDRIEWQRENLTGSSESKLNWTEWQRENWTGSSNKEKIRLD
jgi:hypothetical protein